jgi:AraC-like DNA-binding protein
MMNLLFICTGLIGFIVSFLLLYSVRNSKISNMYLLIIILIISMRFSLYGLKEFISNPIFNSSFTRYSYFSLLVIPLCYLYFKNSKTTDKINRKDALHLLLPLIFPIIKINITTFKHESVRFTFIAFITVFILAYLFLSFKALRKDTQNNTKIKNWNRFLFILICLITIRLLYSISIELYSHSIITGFTYQWVSALFWLLILFKLLMSPEIIYAYEFPNQKTNKSENSDTLLKEIWSTSTITNPTNIQHLALKEKIDKNIIGYIEKIESKSLEFETFRYSKMNLTFMANKLNIPKSHLSYIFKYHCKISFSEYKNIMRIHNAIKYIEQDYLKNNTLDSLSKEVGFKSYNPFFTSFKEITGTSPLEFYKKQAEILN